MTRKSRVGYNTIAKVSEPRLWSLVLSSIVRPFSLLGGVHPPATCHRRMPRVLGAGLNRSESLAGRSGSPGGAQLTPRSARAPWFPPACSVSSRIRKFLAGRPNAGSSWRASWARGSRGIGAERERRRTCGRPRSAVNWSWSCDRGQLRHASTSDAGQVRPRENTDQRFTAIQQSCIVNGCARLVDLDYRQLVGLSRPVHNLHRGADVWVCASGPVEPDDGR